jgi:2-polyprenyl-6-methoxyphenol hydroxylase-like FAD-dependent oxidoreductase
MFDAIVVGARCAGAATALLLARKGHKVLLLDKARFPSDIPHGHFIHRQGPRLLHSWGLLNTIVATGCPAVTRMATDFGDFSLVGTDLIREGVALGYGPRRRVLDQVLIDAAVRSGAEFREGFSVDEVLSDGSSITGIRGRSTTSDKHVAEQARITVGADGRHSLLARAVGAPPYEGVPSLTCWYFSYWSGAPMDGLEVYVRGRSVIFAFPTNDALSAIFIAWDVAEFARIRQNVEAAFLQALQSVPAFAERISAGRREERFYGTADLPNFFRKPYGPGWALVGDAGHHKDPYLALGVCDAFRDAELLASAIHAGLSGAQPLTESLAAYEANRNAESMPLYRENLYMAQFQPMPQDLLALRAALRGNQEQTNKFYMAREGMIPPGEFFNPANLRALHAGQS